MMKGLKLLVFLILFFVFQNVSALEVTPSIDIVIFESNAIKSASVHVRNMEDKEVLAEMSLYGEMENITNFEAQTYLFAPKETKVFNFNILMPESFEKPGDYRFYFLAREIAIDELTEFINVLTASATIYVIRVPYEGPYMAARLRSTSVSVGELVPFDLKMENFGSVPLKNINGKIEIFNSFNKSVGEIPVNEILELGEIKEIIFKWNPEENGFGDYWARATLNFEGRTVEAETEFKLGDIHVSILDYDKNIENGIINKFKLKIKSDWGNEIEGVIAVLEVYHNPFKSFKSETFKLDLWEEKNVVIYVDAENMNPGKYPAKLSLIYEGIHTEEEFELNVSTFDWTIIWIGGSIFVVVFIIGYFVIHKMGARKKNKK
ncbi:hypothetical protein HOG16_01090 [Candidatus Woesearchaeota archaeon]|jgi:hypothetical protein|nr:hypothetical protein [Candidatus Woesearchaeota archaeon]MBT4322168.1 hypothetical protein [Candidatus Woesearchaeota archaeon]MBT4630916.1 hypothetical protein [Candidatus Woesearchaeota archaeon]